MVSTAAREPGADPDLPGQGPAAAEAADASGPVPNARSIYTYRLRIPMVPPWAGYDFARLHPELRLAVVDVLPVDAKKYLTRLLVYGENAHRIARDIRRERGIHKVTLLGRSEGVAEYEILEDVPFYVPVLQKLRIMRRVPYMHQAGISEWVIVASASKMRALMAGLRKYGLEPKLVSKRPGTSELGIPGLTRRQSEIFHRAVVEGYYDVPRRVTLTALSKMLKVSKASLSETLARVEMRLLKPRILDPHFHHLY
ncbi:MAG: helix-turn-helix domain-containing protein [Thermoplasmata archaeon]